MPAPILIQMLPYLIGAAGAMGGMGLAGRGGGSRGPAAAGGRGPAGAGGAPFELSQHLQSLTPELGTVTQEVKGLGRAIRDDFRKGAVTGLIRSFLRITRVVDRTSLALIELGRHLAQYSAQHAFAVAQLEVDRIYRDIEMGRVTGPSFQNLTASRSRLEERMLPWRQAGSIIANRATALATDLLARFLGLFDKLPRIIELIDRALGGQPSTQTGASVFMDAFGREAGRVQNAAPNRRPRVN